jgi:hypothetical protein
MALPNSIPNRVATYGTTYPSPGDTDKLMANDVSLDGRVGTLEGLSSGGAFINVRLAGGCTANGTTDDSAKIQGVIDASTAGDTLYFDRMFGCGALNGGIAGVRLKAKRHYVGADPSETGLRPINGANLSVLACDEGWYNNATVCSQPITISNMKFQGNAANQTAGNGDGVLLFNFWSRVFNCLYEDARGSNQVLTVQNRAGTQISNVISDPRWDNCDFRECGGTNFKQIDPSFVKAADGRITNAYFSGGIRSIDLQSGQGWIVRNAHCYTAKLDSIYIERGYATSVEGCYVEGWGADTASTADKVGIAIMFATGPWPSVMNGNIVTGPTDASAGSIRGMMYYGVSGATTQVTISSNTLYGGTSGDVGLWVESQGGGGTVNVAGLNTNSISNFTQALQINAAVTSNAIPTTAFAAATGTATRSTFATSTVTLPVLAEHVKALIDDLQTKRILP